MNLFNHSDSYQKGPSSILYDCCDDMISAKPSLCNVVMKLRPKKFYEKTESSAALAGSNAFFSLNKATYTSPWDERARTRMFDLRGEWINQLQEKGSHSFQYGKVGKFEHQSQIPCRPGNFGRKIRKVRYYWFQNSHGLKSSLNYSKYYLFTILCLLLPLILYVVNSKKLIGEESQPYMPDGMRKKMIIQSENTKSSFFIKSYKVLNQLTAASLMSAFFSPP